jgi:hypothetical protein
LAKKASGFPSVAITTLKCFSEIVELRVSAFLCYLLSWLSQEVISIFLYLLRQPLGLKIWFILEKI